MHKILLGHLFLTFKVVAQKNFHFCTARLTFTAFALNITITQSDFDNRHEYLTKILYRIESPEW